MQLALTRCLSFSWPEHSVDQEKKAFEDDISNASGSFGDPKYAGNANTPVT
ncbi:predicted protein [Botrytis cinerea T4]|uniref:Uncharacterized protein n=1 Tax=Botryotinia fuckeliana (strain T4) TaxID=999810 RepID=G2YNU9_BOTF4|nr:predicted protein [Botrytis cinerea T4]